MLGFRMLHPSRIRLLQPFNLMSPELRIVPAFALRKRRVSICLYPLRLAV